MEAIRHPLVLVLVVGNTSLRSAVDNFACVFFIEFFKIGLRQLFLFRHLLCDRGPSFRHPVNNIRTPVPTPLRDLAHLTYLILPIIHRPGTRRLLQRTFSDSIVRRFLPQHRLRFILRWRPHHRAVTFDFDGHDTFFVDCQGRGKFLCFSFGGYGFLLCDWGARCAAWRLREG